MGSAPVAAPLPDRFWQKIDTSGDCHLWRGGRDGRGWGSFRLDGRARQVNRLVYEHYFGPVPEGLIAAPTVCLNKLCCRPEHLNAVTHAEWRRAQDLAS